MFQLSNLVTGGQFQITDHHTPKEVSTNSLIDVLQLFSRERGCTHKFLEILILHQHILRKIHFNHWNFIQKFLHLEIFRARPKICTHSFKILTRAMSLDLFLLSLSRKISQKLHQKSMVLYFGYLISPFFSAQYQN